MKRAIFQITDCLLVHMFKAFQKQDDKWRVFRVKGNALPDDAKPIRCWPCQDGVIEILIESESFEDIKQGDSYPTLPCVLFEVQTGKDEINLVEYK